MPRNLPGVLLMALLLIFTAAQWAGSDEAYDEWRESPTITLDCGTFTAVRVLVDGRETENRGLLRGGRTYLPAREALERLGGQVRWVQQERSFYGQFPNRNRTIKVTVGSPVVQIYRYNANSRYGAGERVSSLKLAASPFQCEGRIFAPIRTAAEAAGATVQYESRNETVRILSPWQDRAR